jgi:hypothetical protein
VWEETEAAAQVRWEDPVAFLWRARRVTEALLHALRVKSAPDSPHEPNASIDGLLSDKRVKTLLGVQVAKDVRGLQDLGNLGAHIQGETIDSVRSSEIAAAQLVGAVTWFFDKHPLRGVGRDVWEPLLAGMRDRGRHRPGPQERAQRATDRVLELDTQLAEARRTVEASSALVRHAGAPPPLPTRRWLLVGLALTIPSLAVGALAGSVMGGGIIRPAPSVRRATVMVADAAVAVIDRGDVRASVVAEVPHAPPAPPAPPACPSGTVELPETTVTLLPPRDRPQWPRPVHPGQPQRQRVARVCLEERPASVQDVISEMPDLRERFHGCCLPPRPSAAMPCLTYDDATRWCTRRAGWRLPRLTEWEALAARPRGEASREVTVRESLEWVEDHFPPEIFGLMPTSQGGSFVTRGPLLAGQVGRQRPRYSWNQHQRSPGTHLLFVRCAFDPSSSGGSDPTR